MDDPFTGFDADFGGNRTPLYHNYRPTAPGNVGTAALTGNQRPSLKASFCSCRKFYTLW